jgi:hypothetical protein
MALVAEAMGSLLVELVGLHTPAAGVLTLPAVPLKLGQNDECLRLDEAIQTHPGEPAYCNQFVRNAIEHTPGMECRQQPLKLLALFVVDAFMWHFDRTAKTPNILWDEHVLIAIDHGRALFEMELIDESGASRHDPAEHRAENWPAHVMFEYLRNQFVQDRLRPEQISAISKRLQECLTGQFMLEVTSWLAVLTATRFQNEVAYFLKKRVAAIDSLTREISHVLANR